MANNLFIFSTTYNNVIGFKAADANNHSTYYSYIKPTGNLAITSNNNNINVTNYATVSVNVPSSGITPSGTINITHSGETDVTNYAIANVSEAELLLGESSGRYQTIAGTLYWQPIMYALYSGGYINDGTQTIYGDNHQTVTTGTVVIPTESIQTIGGANYMMENAITVNAITATYVGSGVTQRSSSDLTISGATITAPAGYYATAASTSIPISIITNSALNGQAFLETTATNDYAWKSYITIPAGYYNNTTLTATYSTIFPAPTSAITVDKMLLGYQAYDKDGKLLTGTMPNNSYSATLTDSITSVTIPAGYHNGSGTVSHLTTAIPNPTISFNTSTGAIIANGNWTKGFTTNSSYSSTTSITVISLPTSTSSTTNGGANKVTIGRSTSNQYINIPVGYNATTAYYTISAVTNGSATPAATISATAATITVGTNTITLSKSVSNTPTVSAGYISAGTAGNSNVSLTASVTTKGATTYTPGTSTTSIAAGTYLTGTQTILGDANLVAGNIKSGVSIFGVPGSYEGSGSGGSSSSMAVDVVQNSSNTSTTLTFTGLKGEPTSFSVMVDESVATGTPFKVAAVVYDGTNIHTQIITNTNNAQVSYSASEITYTYNNGTLVLQSSTAQFVSVEHYLVYTYGGSSSNIGTVDVQVGSGATSITFTGVEDEPECWYCIFKSNFNTSNGYQRVIFTRNTGTSIEGLEMDSSAKPALHWNATYNNGSLTITSNGTNSGGYFHQPGYYQLTYAISGDQSLQTKTVTPTTSTQNITADSGYTGLKKVVVNPIPSSYVQPTTTIGSTTYRASTSTQTINAGTYHSAAATIAAVTQSNLTAANIKSGVTITISNGQSNLWSVTGSYTGDGGSGSGESWHIGTSSVTNSSNTATSINFTNLSGTPKAFFARCTTTLTRSSSYRYYYVASMRYNGTNTYGNRWYMYNGQFSNITSGYSYSYSNGTLTLSSSGGQSSTPGAFYNGTYELTYIY